MVKASLLFFFCLSSVSFAGSVEEEGLPPYPEYGPTEISFAGCSADGHQVEVGVRISNFSMFDMELPANRCLDANHQPKEASDPNCTCEYMEKIEVEGELKCQQYVWASKEEMAVVTEKFINEIFPPFVAQATTEQLQQDFYYQALLNSQTTISGTLSDGRTGDWPVSASLKVQLLMKMDLMSQGKYSTLSWDMRPENNYLKVDEASRCVPGKN